MSPAAAEILERALSLDPCDRAAIATALLESLAGDLSPDAAEAWEAEIRRRIEEIDAGAVELVPWSEVRERLHRG